MTAIGAAPASAVPDGSTTLTHTRESGTDTERGHTAEEAGNAPLAVPANAPAPVMEATATASTAAPTRLSLRDAAHRVLSTWDDESGERGGLGDAIAGLRAILVKVAPAARATGIRKPREGTKQQ